MGQEDCIVLCQCQSFHVELVETLQGGCSRALRRLMRLPRIEMVSVLHRQKYA